MPHTADCRLEDRLRAGAAAAVTAALDAAIAGYDRRVALARFHRLPPELVAANTVEAGRRIVAEVERALRMERARIGHWSYDLDRHIALLATLRAEKARLSRL